MKKFISFAILFGILGFGFRHVLKPTAKGGYRGLKIARKVVL